jgi:hypothetical protein
VVKFVSQAVVPLNRAKINPIELIRSVLLQSVEQSWEAFGNVIIFFPGDGQPSDSFGETQLSLYHEFDGIVDTDHCESTINVCITIEER